MSIAPASDLPDVVREVADAFAAYEHALNANDVVTLNCLFWDDPRTLRYGVNENLYGAEAIAAFRKGRRPPGVRRLGSTVITTFGRDCASAAAEFHFPSDERVGRQTQIWIRTNTGWRIAAAHVSFLAATPEIR